MLSVIIPSYKDPSLKKTVDSLLVNSALGNELEIIAVFDGYWPTFEITNDPRVRYIHLGKNRGMRDAINAGVSVSRGEFIMRSDEHCMFAKGFDKAMTDACQDNWILTARRYFLDPVKWQVMDLPYVDYEKLSIQTAKYTKKFTGIPWKERQEERKNIEIDETMAMQGSVWVMKRSWWDRVIGELQTEGYGPMYQDSHEMVFKTWKAGGKLMVNKKTWFAHKHVSFQRTHRYGNTDFYPNLKYAHDLWRPYYEEIRKQWKI
ncbi:MAG: glycosyltransferase [Candidatus Curtissbacteria bacterium]|nr:glycosyltransferase [Candidatus Curtissbacteria bacterium]